MGALQIHELVSIASVFNADGCYSIKIIEKESRNSNEGITASFSFSASLRWNYPNRFGGSPNPAVAEQGLSAQ
jgi:hypothetical protein